MRDQPLLAWQRRLYDGNHQERANLLIHVLTVPLFMLGTVAVAGGWLLAWWWPLVGVALMVAAMAAQGRGHRREAVAPVPFAGAGDVLARIFVEQWVTFWRYVASGGFAAAWRGQPAADEKGRS
jgi:hypothetical protein